MTTVEEATRIVLENTLSFGTESISVHASLGRVLAQDIVADTDLPPFNRIMMDGIAIRKEDFDNGTRTFSLAGMQRAGDVQHTLGTTNGAIEVMTGAVLPLHTNAIVPYEQIEIKDGVAIVQMEEVKHFQNVHVQGLDKKKGDILVKKHTKVSAAEIGVAVSVGCAELEVLRLPSIHIFSTGDELVEVNEQPLPHQIRRSNVYALQQLLKEQNIAATQSHINDEYNAILTALQKGLGENDIVILTGGVSKGKYDLIPKALEECGVQQLFHRIEQRPGKPMWFGKKGDKVVFAFPGNPVSTFMCAVRYMIPYLRKCLNQSPFEEVYLKLAEDFKPHPSLTFFAQVKLHYDKEGNAWATPVGGNGSGDFSNLVYGDAFLEIPAGDTMCLKGSAYKAFLYRA